MPLIVLCGYPLSGKTTFARKLESICEQKKVACFSKSDGDLNEPRDLLYRDSKAEKTTRARLRTEIERVLDKESLVICDSLNYIKGYRYELFCLARSLNTQYALVFCISSREQVMQRNYLLKQENGDYYSDEVLRGLMERFEPPLSENRWERPPFVVDENTDVDRECEQIISFCKDAKVALRAVIATKKLPVTANNILEQAEKVTQRIETQIFERCEPYIPLQLAESSHVFQSSRKVTLAELRKIRRSFMRVIQKNLSSYHSEREIADSFVEYLNTQLQQARH
ncbi:Protein KTI12 [Galdieria sulphuraria]|uniref:Chromatin associated protein KTI12 n=1 Tax=Galdieria sulphuraria TaxID=130081 RepID=M2Y2I3_GALSU|nr:uncharacterized protein Gasu_26110 [Galdieria sulphuraria]EME30024.1 hypothetical protein Gasu_26110 [Galdieria sulphuraria]GJD06236.1 Protein KTI12 [Galdieria sulphuraria]|eukprot:XP_005706544.1 hypothetical protein Gasu_26110 [Galdieria sulphuraria]